jgi:hypothetical protein
MICFSEEDDDLIESLFCDEKALGLLNQALEECSSNRDWPSP